MRRAFLAVIAIVVTLIHASICVAQQNPPQAEEQKSAADWFTQEDKAEVIKLSLERALVQKKIPDYNIIEKQEFFLLSTENITRELVPEIEGINLILLTPEQIQERAESRGDYVYYFRFTKFEVEDAKVRVSLDNIPMYAKKPTRLAFGGGFTIEFQKIEGKWIGKEVINWIA